jgi:hypothetical protein
MATVGKALGDDGERFAARLLRERGYEVNFLPTNYKSYDLQVRRGEREFLVSVKVSQHKQHVRLGSRSSVSALTEGHFVFAFLPAGKRAVALQDGGYRLLIVPAEIARDDGLGIHDSYCAEKGIDKSFSVMVKGYSTHPRHTSVWPRWLTYSDAWRLLP